MSDKRQTKDEHQAPADRDKQMDAIGRGLAAIDDNVRAHGYPGEPGTGLFLLLENVAAQLGINRAGFPLAAPQVEPVASVEEEERKEAERKEAERHASRSRR